MTLRLALVIDGDARGAKQAMTEARGELKGLKSDAEAAGRAVEQANKAGGPQKIEWNTPEFDAARSGLKSYTEDARGAASASGELGGAAGGAVGKITEMGGAAERASGGLGKFRGLAAGAAGLLGGFAVGLFASGFEQAAGGVIDYARAVFDNTGQIERDLKSHKSLIDNITKAFGEARGGASSYGNASKEVLAFEANQNVRRLQNDYRAELGEISISGGGRLASLSRDLNIGAALGELDADSQKIKSVLDGLFADLRAGNADIIAFRTELAGIGNALPAESPLHEGIASILEQTGKLGDLQEELRRSQDVLKGVQGDAGAMATAVGGSAEKYTQLGQAAGAANPAVAASGGAFESSAKGAIQAAGAVGQYVAQMLAAQRASAGAGWTPGQRYDAPPGGGFAGGGFTGYGGVADVAGVVHGQEFVINAAATARNRPLLEAINAGKPGYAAGGFAGPWGRDLYPAAPSAYGAYSGGYGAIGALNGEVNILSGTLRSFGQAIISGSSAADAAAGVFNQVADKLIDKALTMIDQLVFGGGSSGGGGLLGSLFGGGGGDLLSSIFGGGAGMFPSAPIGLYHGGGGVGNGAVSSRNVPLGLFAGAPRLHTGGWLKPGERPIIAKDGEEVGWPSQLAAKYGGAGGKTEIEVSLSPDLEARILGKAQNASVAIVRADGERRRGVYENGGEWS